MSDARGNPQTPASTYAAHDLVIAQRELATLYAALDHVDSGLLILDGQLRVIYSNPALHRMFQSFSAEEIRTRKYFYEELLRAAQATSTIDLDDYLTRRLAWVRSGDPTPMDLRMSSGKVIRCSLAVLPDDGRMLIYSDVTDIVRKSEELERLATTDGMTGIYNRRHFMTLAELEWNKSCRYSRPLAVLVIDIDHFKSINDNFGHQAGDAVIVHLAQLATSCKRVPDVLARIGGEEFALLLPETDLAQAEIAAERLRAEIASETVVVAGQPIRVTVSIGIAARSLHAATLGQLIDHADRALYEAKRAGRNRVVKSIGKPEPSVCTRPAAELALTAAE